MEKWFDDLDELYDYVDDLIEEYLDQEMVNMYKADFYKNMIEDLTEQVCADFGIDYENENADIATLDLHDEIEDFIEETVSNLFDNMGVPERSSGMSVCSDEPLTNSKLAELTCRINYLKTIDQPTQRSEEWYQFRHGLISASNLWKVFGTDSNKNSLIYEKCKPLTYFGTGQGGFVNTNSPLHWGQKYEPLSVMIYEEIYDTEVADFGCIKHERYPCIGASPDGINVDTRSGRFGRMLEIKNIVNREITGIPAEAYWVQTQIQMETCGLDECDFLETRFLEYNEIIDPSANIEMNDPVSDADQFYQDYEMGEHDHMGLILYFVDRVPTVSSVPKYEYLVCPQPDLRDRMTRQDIERWILAKRGELTATHILYKPIYWYLADYSCVLIKRNRIWFECVCPLIVSTWQTILYERENGYEHRAAKKRSSSITDELVSNSQVVKLEEGKTSSKPIVQKHSVCLVKLD
jgi:putative phage-type endonuclease